MTTIVRAHHGAIVGRPSASSSLGALRRPLRGFGLDEAYVPPRNGNYVMVAKVGWQEFMSASDA